MKKVIVVSTDKYGEPTWGKRGQFYSEVWPLFPSKNATYRVDISNRKFRGARLAMFLQEYNCVIFDWWIYKVGKREVNLCPKEARRFVGTRKDFYFRITRLKAKP